VGLDYGLKVLIRVA